MTAGKVKIPSWLSKYLSEEGATQIAQAVKLAETKTQAEIIPMLARRSSPKGHARQSMFLLLMVFGLIFLKLETFELIDEIPGGAYSQLAILALVAFVFAIPLSKLDFFISKFVSINDQRRAVFLKAEHEFYANQFDKTENHSAVLIFISLMERRVVVLADSGISSKVDPDKTQALWTELARMITSSIKEGNLALGVSKAVEKAGDVLSEHLPVNAAQSKKNEISNEIRILE